MNIEYYDNKWQRLEAEPMTEPCLRRCCREHPDRQCQLVKGHDGNHHDNDGHEWLQQDWQRNQ
jgi:hypothetical protein